MISQVFKGVVFCILSQYISYFDNHINLCERKEIIMNQNEIVTEIVSFKTISGISDNGLINIINNLDTNFLSKTKSYIDTELIKGKEEQTWTIIIHWRSMTEATEAIKEFAKSP